MAEYALCSLAACTVLLLYLGATKHNRHVVVQQLVVQGAPDEGVVVHDDVQVISPPAASSSVGEVDLPAEVGGGDLEVLTLAQGGAREAVLIAGVEIVLAGIVQHWRGALHAGAGAHQQGGHRAEVTS